MRSEHTVRCGRDRTGGPRRATAAARAAPRHAAGAPPGAHLTTWGNNGARGDRFLGRDPAAARRRQPAQHGAGRDHRVAGQRADVLRRAVRDVLHDPGGRPELWATEPAKLNIPFSAVNTLNLVLSSVWCQMGVFAAERFQPPPWRPLVEDLDPRARLWTWGMREWFVLTYIAGALFVARPGLRVPEPRPGRADDLGQRLRVGLLPDHRFHGLHVTGGLIAFLLILGRSFAAKRFGHAEATSAIVTSYYWHFVDVVWIGLFFVIYILK